MKYFIFFSVYISLLFSQYIIHEDVHRVSIEQTCPIIAYIDIPLENVHRFSLLYRSRGSIEYIESPMLSIGHTKYKGEIPLNIMSGDTIEYYLLLDLLYEHSITYPIKDARDNPISIKVENNNSIKISTNENYNNDFDIVGLQSDIIILSPQPNETVNKEDFFIGLSFFGNENVDPEKIKIFVDDVDLTSFATIYPTYIILEPYFISAGEHIIKVEVSNKFNQKFENIIWSFNLLPKDLKEMSFIEKQSGKIWADYNSGSLNDSYINNGKLNLLYNLNFDWINIKTKLTKSSLENPYDQVKDKYYIKLNTDIMSIEIGDFYPNFDKYALNGNYVNGINYKFNYSFFSFDFIKGSTARAVQGNPVEDAIVGILDSSFSNIQINLNRKNYTFRQDLLAAKVGVKYNNIYWDANIMQVEDIIPSVYRKVSNAVINLINCDGNDTSIVYNSLFDSNNFSCINDLPTDNWIGNKPIYNIIYGTNLKVAFDSDRINIESGLSISYFNFNTWNKMQTISELDTFIFDNNLDKYFLNKIELDYSLAGYGNYFIFGKNQLPMIPLLLKKDISNFFDIYEMSNLNRYFKIGLTYWRHNIEIGSLRNGPDYYSILNPYLKVNYKENYFSHGFGLLKNKLYIYYKFSKIIDNIYKVIKSPIYTNKSFINFSLNVDSSLPIINISLASMLKKNNLNNITILEQTIEGESTINDSIDRRINVKSNQINISIIKSFRLLFKQIVNLNYYNYNQNDLVNSIMNDYISKNNSSNSFSLNIKTLYNNLLETNVSYSLAFNTIGEKQYLYYESSYFEKTTFNIIYFPKNYIQNIMFSFGYSNGNNDYMPSLDFGLESSVFLLDNFIFDLSYNYYINIDNGKNNNIIRFYIRYDI